MTKKMHKCECGRHIKDPIQDLCYRCRQTAQLGRDERGDMTEGEELEILRRARTAELEGLIPPWRAVDTSSGLRYLMAECLMHLEDFDFEVARRLRGQKGRAA